MCRRVRRRTGGVRRDERRHDRLPEGPAQVEREVRQAARLLVLHVRSPLDMPDHTEGGALARLGEETIAREIEESEHQVLDRALGISRAAGVEAELAYVMDISPSKAIVRIAEERGSDLIVMATRIRHGIPGYFAKSETQKVLEHCEIPVLVIR